MIFELPNETECELTSFTGRVQKSGGDDVPAVTFRLKMAGVSNTLLDKFSPTFRHVAYAAVEGQEQLPGVEPTTPILRSKDLKHWSCETVHEGWTVTVARGINSDSALVMGSSKIDNFEFDLFDGGYCNLEFRISTADVDESGAGMLWGRQKCKVFVRIQAPELPKPAIDGSVEAFKKDHPDAREPDATDLFAAGGESGDETDETGVNADESAGAEDTDAEREQRELEAGMAASIADAGVKPARRGRVAH
jgi:hypothetical protein